MVLWDNQGTVTRKIRVQSKIWAWIFDDLLTIALGRFTGDLRLIYGCG
jgi:hypothetical protein